MKDNWTLSYTGVNLSLNDPAGGGDTFFLKDPEFAPVSIKNEDTDRPRADGVNYGQDFRGGRTITLELGIDGTSQSDALSKLGRLEAAWRADVIRSAAGAVASMTISTPGRPRVVYGRPRRLAWNPKHLKDNYITVVADFAQHDDVFYATTEEAITVASTGSTITVGGDLPAWPVIRLNGAGTNPTVTVTGRYTLGMTAAIAAGDVVTLDSRPWKRTITRTNGTSLAGSLTTGRLAKAGLPPGTYTVNYTGADSVEFTWRNSYASL